MPGTPHVLYLDLFAGANDCEAADHGGSGGHKEINRTILTAAAAAAAADLGAGRSPSPTFRTANDAG